MSRPITRQRSGWYGDDVRSAAALLTLLITVTVVAYSFGATDDGPQVRASVSVGDVSRGDYLARQLRGAWCAEPGLVDRPSVVFGPTVHIAYVIPSDAPDDFQGVGRSIAADVEAIEAWWQREDPGRALRFDRYLAACGAQLDVTVARLAENTRYYERFAVQPEMIVENLANHGLDVDPGVMLVYYVGPVADADVCGAGAGDPEQMIGHTVVFVANCTDRDRARIVAHEILHTLGALPAGARHPCPGDDGHPCDSDADALWPRVDLRPLEEVVLDVGRDDYYGHQSSWFDLRDSVFLRRLDATPTRLRVKISGRGRVTSSSFGLACEASCTTRWDARLEVVLEARPGPGMRFVRWEGGCTGRGCKVALAGGRVDVTAVFAPPTYAVVLTRAGQGRIVSVGFSCAAACTRSVRSHQPLVLRAEPKPGWRLSRWDGGCRGSAARCVLEMRGPERARAVFARIGT